MSTSLDPTDDFAFGGVYTPSGDIGRWWIASFGSVALSIPAGALSAWVFLALAGSGFKAQVVLALAVLLIASVLIAWTLRFARVRSPRFLWCVAGASALIAGHMAMATFIAHTALGAGAGFGALLGGLAPLALDPTALVPVIASDFSSGRYAFAVPLAGVAIGMLCFAISIREVRRLVRAEFYDEAGGRWYPKPQRIGDFVAGPSADGLDFVPYSSMVAARGEPAAFIEYEYFPSKVLAKGPAVDRSGELTGASHTGFVLLREVLVERSEHKRPFRRSKRVALKRTEYPPFFIEVDFVRYLLEELDEAGLPAPALKLPEA
ncbi:MAG: hypothetical protein LW636_09005 [Planctomycetaceae bacterium]|nr:hypothetical protein [Planctomycetaceae bacterium]